MCFIRAIMILSVSFYSISVFSAPLNTKNIYNKFSELYQTGQSKALYSKALQFRDELEGEADFDYFFGVSAIDNDSISEGVFALERVLFSGEESQYFNQHLVRVELARGYFLLGDNNKSKAMFNEVLTYNPPQDVVDKVALYLKVIEERGKKYQPQLNGFIEQSFGYDDNVNALPGDDISLGTSGSLSAALFGESDFYSETKIGGSYTHPLNRKKTLFIDADYFNRTNDTVDEMDNHGFNLNIGANFEYDKTHFNVSYYHQDYNLDNESYRKMDGLLGEYKYSVSNRTLLTGNLSLMKYDYKDNALLDALEFIYRVGAMHQFDNKFQSIGYFQVYFGHTDADENDSIAKAITQRTITGVNIGTQMSVGDDITLGGSFYYQDSEYQGEHPWFSSFRRDYMSVLSVDMIWDLKEKWKVLGKISHIDNYSSLALYKYRKTYGQVGIRYEF
ncbi:MAG: hypothetical protein OQL19_04980 [Gammaproteobacteria bacterium]|nr:hypothetical protein [Gammaproteobacteria bacterium]